MNEGWWKDNKAIEKEYLFTMVIRMMSSGLTKKLMAMKQTAI
jgi:hypothetical protein